MNVVLLGVFPADLATAVLSGAMFALTALLLLLWAADRIGAKARPGRLMVLCPVGAIEPQADRGGRRLDRVFEPTPTRAPPPLHCRRRSEAIRKDPLA